MPAFQLDIIAWIIVGFFAGALSGVVVKGDRSASGCLPNILIGILGGLVGGFLAGQILHTEAVTTWFGAFVIAFVGAVIVRWLLNVANRR